MAEKMEEIEDEWDERFGNNSLSAKGSREMKKKQIYLILVAIIVLSLASTKTGYGADVMLLQDSFDDDNIVTNTNGVGDGFTPKYFIEHPEWGDTWVIEQGSKIELHGWNSQKYSEREPF